MKTLGLIFITLFFSLEAAAKVSVMFHPYDPTLQTIGEYIERAKQNVDIAMYNLDATMESPLIQKLASENVQARIRSGDLNIRLIYEGYGAEGNKVVMQNLENLGVDVRFLGGSKKVHHKFAVIDGNTLDAILITGSANWSLSSQNFYNENILFFEEEPALASSYQGEFELIWGISKEFGVSLPTAQGAPIPQVLSSDLQSFFNTENFLVSDNRIKNNNSAEGYALTRQIVKLIDEANSHIEIATTRVMLRPVYEALIAAAARGVKIELVVTMGEYAGKGRRDSYELKVCADIYEEKCSTSQNFAVHLANGKYEGSENVTVRLKYFHLNTESYLNKQMHSKYILVDSEKLITGSFNWSYSAEYSHIENIIRLEGPRHQKVLASYAADFERLWKMNRADYGTTLEILDDKLSRGEKVDCNIAPMTLEFKEIDKLLSTVRRHANIRDLCNTGS